MLRMFKRRYIYSLLALFSLLICAHANATLTQKQQAFINFILPIAKQENKTISDDRAHLQKLFQMYVHHELFSQQQQSWCRHLAKQYRLKSFNTNNKSNWNTLLTRVDIIPTSLTLAQAANESAWGQSRFARQGNNYFGIICHRPGCGIVPRRRNAGAKFEVTRYSSARKSVQNYLHTLNTNPQYQLLRTQLNPRIENPELQFQEVIMM